MMLNKCKFKKQTNLPQTYLGCLTHRPLSFQCLQYLQTRGHLQPRKMSTRCFLYAHAQAATQCWKKYNQASWFHFQFNDHNLKSANKTAYQFCFSPVLIFLDSIQFPLHIFYLIYSYFIYFHAIENAIVLLIEISDCLLLLYRNTLQYCILVLYHCKLAKDIHQFQQLIVDFDFFLH